MKASRCRVSLFVLLPLLAAGCASPAEPDGGPPDGSTTIDAATPPDAGARDAANPDAEPIDGDLPDAGEADAGELDASEADAGHDDAGELDATESDAGHGDLDASEADAGADEDGGEADANEPDANEPDAGEEDAGAADAASPHDAGPDGGFAGDACPVPPSLVDGPFAPGPPPPSANLLLTDTAANRIYRLALDGTVLEHWPSPASQTFGVSHDRRSPNGFWVIGRDVINMPNVFRLSATGTITASFNVYAPNGTVWGLDYARGSTPALDLLVYVNRNSNSLPTVTGTRISTRSRWFEAWMMQPTGAQWYGAHLQRYACDDPVTLVFWTTRGGVLELRQWVPIMAMRSLPIPGTTDARGVTRTPRGDFYVVDNQNDQVLHLSDTGVLLGSFATPGTTPADISYGE